VVREAGLPASRSRDHPTVPASRAPWAPARGVASYAAMKVGGDFRPLTADSFFSHRFAPGPRSLGRDGPLYTSEHSRNPARSVGCKRSHSTARSCESVSRQPRPAQVSRPLDRLGPLFTVVHSSDAARSIHPHSPYLRPAPGLRSLAVLGPLARPPRHEGPAVFTSIKMRDRTDCEGERDS
jgi:hypothetical protein